jgi:hypothetical protein
MALPRLNDNPQYELIIPSSGKSVNYRPFLVKEQRNLLIAYESQDRKQILNAMLNTIESCVSEELNLKKLTTFDVDYMFTQIRSKSVGETSDIIIRCSECDHENEQHIKLDEIKVPMEERNMLIQVTPDLNVRMRYPNYDFFLKSQVLLSEDTSQSDMLLALVVACLESVETENERIDLGDESYEEILAFLESLTTEQFDKIGAFTLNMPSMEHDIEFDCEQCNHHNTRKLKGLQDFF